MNEIKHVPVLLEEAIIGLKIKPNGIYVDCTLGGGGHSRAILENLNDRGKLYCFDQDDYAIQKSIAALHDIPKDYKIICSNFMNIKAELMKDGITEVDGILYDLGVSSFQLDDMSRGFSYHSDSDLDMRMNQNQYLKALDIVNYYTYDELNEIFIKYGEERYSKQIAKRIMQARDIMKIETCGELVDIIIKALPARIRRKEKHPAKKVFQALRIAVNDELNALTKSLNDALDLIKVGGRICVISFQSLEDRICKQIFNNRVEVKIPKGLAIKEKDISPAFKLINKKPITPGKKELEENPRSHSAKLRIIERIKEGESSYGKF